MSDSMAVLPSERLMPGMVLAERLLDADGVELLTAGTVLTAAHITSLRRRRIAQVAIVPADAAPAMGEAAIRARLRHLFRRAEESEPGRALHEIVLSHRLERSR